MAFTVQRPQGQRPICGQCRRDVESYRSRWFHLDGTPRCPQGALENVVVHVAAIAAAGGHSVWIGDGRPHDLKAGAENSAPGSKFPT